MASYTVSYKMLIIHWVLVRDRSPTHRAPSRVPMLGIWAHDSYLSWHLYIWIAVFLIFYRHVICWNIFFLMFISKCILLDHGYKFDTQRNFINCKTWRNNCLIICLWQILLNNMFIDVSIFTTISLQFNELIITSINKI